VIAVRAVQVPRPAAAAPQFSRQLDNVTLDEGSTATLECQVTGHPDPGVRWYKEGRPLTASQKVRHWNRAIVDGRLRSRCLILTNSTKH